MGKALFIINHYIKLEIRSSDNILVFFLLSFLISILLCLGVKGAYLTTLLLQKIFPGLLWSGFILIVAVAMERASVDEHEEAVHESLLLAGVTSKVIFLANMIRNFLLIVVGSTVQIITSVLLLDISTLNLFLNLLPIVILSALGLSSLTVLLSSISLSSKLRGILFVVLLIPLTFPLYFASTELTYGIIFNDKVNISIMSWYLLLLVCDTIYFTIGWFVYGNLLKS
jgi:ABC-type transport system involved in cytochrome c biogenesis permease component